MGSEQNSDYYNTLNTDQIYLDKIENIYRRVYEKAMTLINFKKSPKILDIGCGSAPFVKFLKNINYKNYLGIDFADKVLEFSKKRFPEYNFTIGDLTDKKFLKKIFKKFNFFVCFEVLEHIDSDLEIIETIPQGREFVFSVPNFDCKGHVRFFKNFDEIKNRYSHLLKFDDTCIFKIPRKRTNACFFLAKTVRL